MRTVLLSLIALMFTAAQAQQAADLMPDDNEISGWVKDGEPQTAQTPEELYGLINGAAPVYLDNGFVECVFQDYVATIEGQQTILNARVFDQGDAANAQTVYTLTATGLETDWTGAGQEARINYTLPFNFVLDFWRNRFFVHLVINREADSLQTLQAIKDFAVVMDGTAVPVELASFRARRASDRVVITWTTTNETMCFGFEVLRSETAQLSGAVKITENIVPGSGASARGQDYRFEDESAPSGVDLHYWLEEISLSGQHQFLGPTFLAAGSGMNSWGSIKASFGE